MIFWEDLQRVTVFFPKRLTSLLDGSWGDIEAEFLNLCKGKTLEWSEVAHFFPPSELSGLNETGMMLKGFG
jgi:hypothetical protein